MWGSYADTVPLWASQVAQRVKNPPANSGDVRDTGSIPGSGRSPGEGNGNPLQYSCLGKCVDRGAWWVTVHGVTNESDTTQRLNNKQADPGWGGMCAHMVAPVTETPCQTSGIFNFSSFSKLFIL